MNTANGNMVDGSILAYQIGDDVDGAYVTITGDGDTPIIVHFDSEDLDVLRRMLTEAVAS